MTKTPNPAPMAMCNSARSTVEWVGRPTPLPSRAASRLRLESALALKPAEWGGAPPLLSRRAARAPLRAARYATSHNNHQPTTPHASKTPSRHNHPVVSVGRVGHAASRARAAAVAVAVAVARRGVRRRRALRRRCVAQLARSTAEAATGASKRDRRRRATRSARRVTRPRTGPVPPRAPCAAPRSHRGGGRRSASARARRPRRLIPRTARDAGRPLAGVASSCPRRPPPLGLEVARATVAAPPTGRRMRALDDGRDDSRSLMMMI